VNLTKPGIVFFNINFPLWLISLPSATKLRKDSPKMEKSEASYYLAQARWQLLRAHRKIFLDNLFIWDQIICLLMLLTQTDNLCKIKLYEMDLGDH
jgi:hypothetical protein